MDIVIHALNYAAEKHAGQRRRARSAKPYINHPLGVMDILVRHGRVTDAVLLAAAALHDVVEDTGTPIGEVMERFGEPIGRLVAEVTDDPNHSPEENKERYITKCRNGGYSPAARALKLADLTNNIDGVCSDTPAHWSMERLSGYLDWASRFGAVLKGVNPGLEAEFARVLAREKAQLRAVLGREGRQ